MEVRTQTTPRRGPDRGTLSAGPGTLSAALIVAAAALQPIAAAEAAPLQWAQSHDAAGLLSSMVGLARAITSAETEAAATGFVGRAVHARFDVAAGVFRITLLSRTDLTVEDVDPSSGKVIVIEPTQGLEELDAAARSILDRVGHQRTDLSDAIAAADQDRRPVVDAGIDRLKNRLVYRIDVVEDGRLERRDVDITASRVVADTTPVGAVRPGS